MKALAFVIKALLVLGIAILSLFVISGASDSWGIPKTAAITLVILCIAAALWITEAVPLFVTSFVILFLSLIWLLPHMGQGTTRSLFLAPFFSDIILLFLGGFVLSTALHKYQLDEQMARWMIRRTGSTLPRLMLGIMLITAFLSMFLSNTATAAMMLALVLPIVRDLEPDNPARKALILAVPFSANAGGLGTPVGSPPNAIAMTCMKELGVAPTFGKWMLLGVPGVIIVIILAWLVLLIPSRGKAKLGQLECARLKLTWNKEIFMVLGITFATVLGWLTQSSHGWSTGTVSLIPLIVFFGGKILNIRDLRSLSWDVLLLMGGGLCLGTAISASGLASWLVGFLPSTMLATYPAAITFGVAACLMSCLMSNTATANLVMPMIVGLALDQNAPVLLSTAVACSIAMALPVSTPPNAMAFASEEIRVADLLKPGILITLISLIIALTLGFWWWGILGVG
ncbi:DASS family sodium-coupled anion symporter [Akkermansiaceae bacterium]|nr:DASS family sodium-coupled anion symporter [Akkermansiaceae bacterium]